MEPKKKFALITDATSGIGLEFARLLAKNNYDLLIASSSETIAEKAKLLRQYEIEVTPVLVDLSTSTGVTELFAKISRPVDIAVFNAGAGNPGEFVRTDFEGDLRLMNLNMVHLVDLSKKILQDMVVRDEGRILFTSTLSAEVPGTYSATYAASQSFLQTFVQALRFELLETKKNIKVTYLKPMPTDPEFYATVAKQGLEALMNDQLLVVGEAFDDHLRKEALKTLAATKRKQPTTLERK